MDEKKYDNSKTFFVKEGRFGMFANCDWDDTVKLFANNFTDDGGYITADVTMPTNETYINKQGVERVRHTTVGFLKYNADKAALVLELNGEKNTYVCKPRTTKTKDGQDMCILNFNGDDASARPANPFAADLAGDLPDIPF